MRVSLGTRPQLQSVELSIVRSQSLANRRPLPSHVKVHSTTQRLGAKENPFNLLDVERGA